MSELTDEQIQELQQKTEELEKFKTEQEGKLKEFEDAKVEWEKKEKEFQEQSNPNWQKARKTMDAMKAALKEKGVETDTDGNVVSNPQKVDVEAIRKEAVQAARGELIGGRLNELLGEYDAESSKVVKHFYDKLVYGEDVNLQNIGKFVKQAHLAAEAETGKKIANKAIHFSGGQGPRMADENTIDETRRQELGQLLGLSFAKKK